LVDWLKCQKAPYALKHSRDAVDVSVFFSNFDQLLAHSQQPGTLADRLVFEHVQLTVLNVSDFLFSVHIEFDLT
jgi:hypothetical protein